MFRYGGPIKEGVMSGIREPKKTGGSMGNLVGSPAYPKTNGREHHAVVSGTIAAGLGLNALRHGAMRYGARYLPRIIQGAKRIFGKNVPQNVGTTNVGGKIVQTAGSGSKFVPNWLGRDPLVQGVGWAGKSIFNPTVGGWAAKGLRMATSPSSIIGGVAWYLWPDGKERKTPPPLRDSGRKGTSGAPGGGDPGMYLTPQGEAPPPGKSEAQLKKEQIQKYRDIMDIKGMNKEAAANSLIEASRLINESGDFKGDLKSGSLINKIIGATSKQFDKPADTKKAIDTLILKGEIEKDLNKEKNKLDNEYKRSMIAKNEAVLAQDSLAGDLRAYATKNQSLPAGNTLAAFATSRGYDIKGVEDTTEVKKWMTENGGNEVAYLEDKITDIEVAPGLYVINNKILAIDESKKITPVI